MWEKGEQYQEGCSKKLHEKVTVKIFSVVTLPGHHLEELVLLERKADALRCVRILLLLMFSIAGRELWAGDQRAREYQNLALSW